MKEINKVIPKIMEIIKTRRYELISLLILSLSIFFFVTPSVNAQAIATTPSTKYLAAGIAIAGSCLGAGIALWGATSAGAAALVEKPALAVWILILAGLSEGVAIYGLIVAILILSAP